MKTIITSNGRLLRRALCSVLIGTAALWALPRSARAQLYVGQAGNGTVGEYNAATGAPINPSFITGLNAPYGLAVGTIPAVPGPSPWSMMAGGGAALLGIRLRKKRRTA